MELGLIDETEVERRQACTKRLYEARTALEEHVSWDRKVRRHLANLVDRMKDLENNISRVIAGGSTICPSWRSQKRLGLLTHQDEMSKPNIPHFTQDSLSDITRYRYDVTAHVSAITGDATVFSHEQGTGAKNSGAVFESILLDHLLTCKGQSVKIIWSDCASVGRSFFSCVATMQYLVDSGLCDLALSGYMANCHGKYLADSLFGQWNTRARNEDITSVDGLLHVFESIKRTGGAKVTGLVLNPISSVNWQANLARLGYAVSPPADFEWESMNPHYSCACKQSVRDSMPPELLTLLEPLMPKFENCVRVSSWPRFDEPTIRIPFNQRPIDVPAAAIRPSTANTATTASITGRVQSNGGPRVTRTRTEIAEDWYLCVHRSRAFASGGDGVVPQSTAKALGHNSSGFYNKIPILRNDLTQQKRLTKLSWPPGFLSTSMTKDDVVKVAPENWIGRMTVQSRSETELKARYPPLNLVNALNSRPPREITSKHTFEATYHEPCFPLVAGTCAYNAVRKLTLQSSQKLSSSVSVLDLYKAVRQEMGIEQGEDVDEFLQPRPEMASAEARKKYFGILKEKKRRNKGRPVGKRNAYQIFRTAAKDEMKSLLKERQMSGERGLTLAKVAAQFWESATSEYKSQFETLALKEDDRIAAELSKFLEWQRTHDDERDGIVR